jgi:thymidylate synthase (FAD)
MEPLNNFPVYAGEEIDVIAHAHGHNRRRNVLDGEQGFVYLVDCMPRMVPLERKTADHAVVQAARVSFGAGLKTPEEDVGVLRYLMRHNHTTPIEMVEFKFHCSMPIFVARQFIRHRTASVNEQSGRYSVLADAFHHPGKVRKQSATNKQGSAGFMDDLAADEFLIALDRMESLAYAAYEKAVSRGAAKEQARIILPLNTYTQWYWKCDAKNLLHFLALRCDSHAQEEIRVYADAMLELIRPIIPETVRAWEDYHPMRGGILLTRMEVEALKELVSGTPAAKTVVSSNAREQTEWIAKLKRLGVGDAS